MDAWVPTLLAVALVSVVSLVGAFAISRPGLRGHRFLLVLVAMAAGTLLGDAFFHLVPEATAVWAGRDLAAMGAWVLGGFVLLFLLEVILRNRHAHVEMVDEAAHLHEGPDHGRVAPFAWTNLAGDALHNFLDGAVIATAFLVDVPLGVATTIAVVIHEVPQELGDFAVLLRAGLGVRRALAFNFLSACTSIAGAVLVLALPVKTATLESYGLPLTTGAFVYIAAADLIPELHHHSRGREATLILLSFLAGLTLMYSVLLLEETGFLGTA
ncbi:MAG TPA: ZIP family metal transporter [Candidatus Thermoplasmatota archaeon]|nr:ZIP family metal transporter [Candidatus Thermoplasmatota archaeon]